MKSRDCQSLKKKKHGGRKRLSTASTETSRAKDSTSAICRISTWESRSRPFTRNLRQNSSNSSSSSSGSSSNGNINDIGSKAGALLLGIHSLLWTPLVTNTAIHVTVLRLLPVEAGSINYTGARLRGER